MADFKYRPYLIMGLLCLVTIIGTAILLRRPEPAALTIATPVPRPTATAVLILVDVRGAIARPGVYTLTAGSRIQDVIVLAGNVTGNAEISGLNLARRLNDGEQIHIPTTAEATALPVAVSAKGEIAAIPGRTRIGRINVNTAMIDELDELPGIGPALAQRIVDYRLQNGSFRRIEDLKQVRGIGDALYEQIRELVTLQ